MTRSAGSPIASRALSLIAVARRILTEGALEVLGDPNVIDHKASRLITEDPVHAGNSLHQPVPRASACPHTSDLFIGRVADDQGHPVGGVRTDATAISPATTRAIRVITRK